MSKITLNSTIKEVYETPVGHDVLQRVAITLGFDAQWLDGMIADHVKIKYIKKLAKKQFNDDFFDTLINLINSETDVLPPYKGEVEPAWWKEAVFYQIYPRTFYDSNGDGIGDLQGMIEKLDELKSLGIDALWLSPIYDSPNDDNGYDIRHYMQIHSDYGTMNDFQHLLREVHRRDMKLIMDLVINHTSDEHAWFESAINDPESSYRDYYYIIPGDPDTPPNNWQSLFSGSAWRYYEDQGVWALHLFSKKQMDLNWHSDALREDLKTMINEWLDMGVDGFRLDVINFISKADGLPDGNDDIAQMMGYRGIEHYFYGPHLNDYLREIHDDCFAPHKAFSVGETPGAGMKIGQMLTSSRRHELDMIFTFDHLESPGHSKYEDYRYDLNYFKTFINDWILNYGNDCWCSLFYNNHDNPKMCSKINPDPQYATSIQTLLAVMQMTLKGTPFIFQGEEMGVQNYEFTSMDQITDVESVNLYQELIKDHSEEEAFVKIKAGTRDHARQLLPWQESSKELLGDRYQGINEDIRNLYKKLIKLRHEHKTLVYGDYEPIDLSKNHFTYRREDENETFIIDCNLSDQIVDAYEMPPRAILMHPYSVPVDQTDVLGPYEARIYKIMF